MNKWMVICMCALLLCGCGTKTSSQDQSVQPSQTQSTPSQTQDQEQQIQPSQAQEEQTQPTEETEKQPSQAQEGNTQPTQKVGKQPSQADSKGTSNSTGTQSDTTGSQKISEQEALEVALSHAGVKKNDLTSKRIKMEWEDGAEVYDIEFHTNGKEYDYEIRASDGSILESDSEIENH